MNQTKIDTLSEAQTRKMTPYAREEQRERKVAEKQSFKIALVMTDHLFSVSLGVYTLLCVLIQLRHPI